jgi:DNA-binding response OmpR family regulator
MTGHGVRGGLGATAEPGWVLVVVGDAVRGMALFRLLEWAGQRATVADTARAALAMLRTEPFDLVLLDVSTDGYEVLRELRSIPGLDQLPVLMVASQDEADAIGPWLEMGADDIVTEPFVPVVLRARVKASLARKRLADREVERRGEIGRIVEAVLAANEGTLEAGKIEAIARRWDPLGQLGQALRRIVAGRSEGSG